MIAAVFPGQGSQKPGMGKALFEAAPWSRDVFKRVFEATGVNVAHLCFETPDDVLRETQNAQLALYTCGVAAFHALRERAPGIAIGATAGHSVGEYAALAAAGAISIEDGALLVQKRGELMASAGSARPGTMAAVLGLEISDLEAICAEASDGSSVVVIANDNCPGQSVISGDRSAVERASALATAKGARRVLPLNVSGAFHSPLMEAPADEMGKALRQVEFQSGERTVYANVTATSVVNAADWAGLLENQLRAPVRWTETIRNMRRDGVEAFVEFGSGEVLCGLIRRIDSDAKTLSVQDPGTLELAVEALGGVRVEA